MAKIALSDKSMALLPLWSAGMAGTSKLRRNTFSERKGGVDGVGRKELNLEGTTLPPVPKTDLNMSFGHVLKEMADPRKSRPHFV